MGKREAFERATDGGHRFLRGRNEFGRFLHSGLARHSPHAKIHQRRVNQEEEAAVVNLCLFAE